MYPYTVTLLSDIETPVSLFHKLKQDAELAFLCESSDGDRRMARFSMLGVDPLLSFNYEHGLATIQNRQTQTTEIIPTSEPLALLQTLQTDAIPSPSALPDTLQEIPFIGGWMGYLGYGMTQLFENIPRQANDVLEVPDAYLGLYDTVIVFDHLYRRIHLISHRDTDTANHLFAKITALIERPLEASRLPVLALPHLPEEAIYAGVETSVTKEEFCAGVEQSKQWITEGQIFQIVLAQRFSLPSACEPLDVYRIAQAINPSPYAYYLQFPEFTYLGSSPETFVRCQNGEIMLHALAGTRPRGSNVDEDLALEIELKNNAKEMAEHRMLVDLGRNDLGRVCTAGSIQVGEIAQVLRYSHVMHLATRISGKIQPEKTGYDAVKSCFPRGTLSGAPKVRAMQLLAQLEPEQRGIYSGFVGYFDLQGNAEGAIAIRSALIKNGQAHVHAGAGVVYQSTAEGEYEETRNKAKGIIKAIQIANHVNHLENSSNATVAAFA